MRIYLLSLLFLLPFSPQAQCDQQCNFSFKLTDTVGDTWNGNTMTVIQGDTSYLITLDLTTGFFQYTYNLPLCENEPFDVIWNSGGAYPNEVVLEIRNPENQIVFSLPAGNRFQDSVIFSGIASCSAISCAQPAALKFTSIAIENPTLTWTNIGGATQWEVITRPSSSAPPDATDSGSLVSATNFTSNQLLPQIDYSFYVRTVCGDSKSAWVRKDLRCPKPYNLVYVTQSRFYDFYTTYASEFSSTYEILLQDAAAAEPTEETNGLITSEQFYKTNGLAEGNYAFFLRSRCSESNISDWHGPMLFSVLCGQPTDVQVLGNQISWTPTGAATQWEVYITNQPFLPTLTTEGTLTGSNPYLAQELTLGTVYYVYVRSNCGNGITSAWSQQLQFEYQGLAVTDYVTFEATIAPNPTSNILQVSASEQLSQIKILDISGKLLIDQKAPSNGSIIDVSDFTSGVYFTVLTAENGLQKTLRFLKQ